MSGKTFGFYSLENFRILGLAETRTFSHKLINVSFRVIGPQSHPGTSEVIVLRPPHEMRDSVSSELLWISN